MRTSRWSASWSVGGRVWRPALSPGCQSPIVSASRDDEPARRRHPRRLEHVGAGHVAAARRHVDAVGRDPERSGAAVEQRAEDARAVEARQAQPLDRAVRRDQRAGVAVREERVVGDRREVSPFAGAFARVITARGCRAARATLGRAGRAALAGGGRHRGRAYRAPRICGTLARAGVRVRSSSSRDHASGSLSPASTPHARPRAALGGVPAAALRRAARGDVPRRLRRCVPRDPRPLPRAPAGLRAPDAARRRRRSRGRAPGRVPARLPGAAREQPAGDAARVALPHRAQPLHRRAAPPGPVADRARGRRRAGLRRDRAARTSRRRSPSAAPRSPGSSPTCRRCPASSARRC